MNTEGGSLYASRVKVHPKAVKGRFRRIKDVMGFLLVAGYFVGPWLRWDRGDGVPDQAVLLDIVHQRGYIFGAEIWPQEIYYLAGILIIGAIALFMTASIAGRVWCGFTCPQTVFTDIFVRIERLFEGDRAARIRMDRQPWTVGKVARKAGKHACWIAVSLLFAATFSFYFVNAPDALADYASLDVGPWMLATLCTLGGATYLLAGFAREQFCNYMCPWPRIQSAMLDDQSLVVTYQSDRGDVRGPKRKSQTWEERLASGFGDCISCGQCVQVCPIGIDIRECVNADCINCGLCIDACDPIMDGIGRPRGLIRFDSFANHASRKLGGGDVTKVLRPKTFTYAAAVFVLSVAMVLVFLSRSTMDAVLIQERSPLHVTMSDGTVRNSYTLKISNMRHGGTAFEVALQAPGGYRLESLDDKAEAGTLNLEADNGSITSARLFIDAERDAKKGGELSLVVTAPDGTVERLAVPFAWPN